ncbi:MAG: TonB family protein [Pseudomonadota bacterium]
MVDQFKKQVMFLHPEPSVMQPCAAMLGDQYSIHMASSGTEALTTLGITPIDIIVSAQDLPGMTGQEALREAKKRSPSTRGILIADETMTADDVAALVTVKHLNQILNANVSVSEICAAVLFELKAKETGNLPQPANDHSAGPRDAASFSPDATGSFRTGATGSFRTDSMQVDLAATGNFESLKQDIPTLEPGVAAVNAPAALSEVELVVLTNDSSFLKTIRAATGTSHVVNHAPNLQEAVDIVQEGRSGVLITDAAVAVKDVETITAKLRRFMPSLVTIVAGRREDGEKMMGLINDGLVYRFLLKPISPGRSRLAIEASAKKHLTLISTDVPLSANEVEEKMTETGIIKGVTFDSGLFRTTDVRESDINMPSLDEELEPSTLGKVSEAMRSIPPLALAGIAVVIAIIGVFLFGGGESENSNNDTGRTESAIATADAPPRQTLAERIDAMMESGQNAYEAGRLAAPTNDNAVFYYAQAAALNRDDPSLRAALDQTLAQVFEGIERNLLDDNIDDAATALDTLNKNVPGHPRLAFFNAQVGKERARLDLAQTERDIAAGNFEQANAALSRLREGGIVDAALLDSLAARIPSTTSAAATGSTPTTPPVPASASELDVLLATATQRLNQGRLVTPENDSARYYFRSALSVDQDSQAARDGLSAVASGLLAQARTAIESRDAATAERAWVAAVDTGANAIEAESVRRQIESLRNVASRPSVQPTSAPTSVASRQPAATATETASASTTPNETAADQQDVLTTIPEVPASIREETVKTETPVEPESKPDTATQQPSTEDILRDVSLVVVESRPPIYPRRAQVQRLEGWVDVQFIVGADGTTRDVTVFESSNAMFDRSAVDAVSDWRYEPLPVDDPEAFKRARVRLKFNLN